MLSSSTLLVATHVDKIHSDQEVQDKKKVVSRLVRCRAEEIGVANILCPKFLVVNAKEMEDCETVKRKYVRLLHLTSCLIDLIGLKVCTLVAPYVISNRSDWSKGMYACCTLRHI